MLNGRVLIFIIFISVVIYNPAYGITKCKVKDGFHIKKMVGTWNYIGGIDLEQVGDRCGKLTMRKVSKHRLRGFAVGSILGNKNKVSFQAYVDSGIFAVRYLLRNEISPEFMLWIRTCNNLEEFSLEIPKENRYLIFSKQTAVTPIYLEHYRKLGDTIGLQLKLANNTNCK